MDTVAIARICHQANKAYCEAIRDFSQVDWEKASDGQRASAINGVLFHLANPEAGPERSHNNWLREKQEAGWVYGAIKSEPEKTHPCCIPYEQLPLKQQLKDSLFISIIRTLI